MLFSGLFRLVCGITLIQKMTRPFTKLLVNSWIIVKKLFTKLFAPFRVKKLVFTNRRSSFLTMSMRKIGVLCLLLLVSLKPPLFVNNLGCPIHDSRPSKQSFQFVIENIEKNLTGWKKKHLSLAGRHTLVKSGIETIPAHVMHCNLLPASITKKIDQLSRDFLRGTAPNHKKIHAVKWSNASKDKRLGGLGLRRSNLITSVSMTKLVWRLHNDDQALRSRG